MNKLLVGSQVRLTACTSADVPTLLRWHQDPEFLRMLDSRPARPASESALADWIRESDSSKNAFLFGVRPVDAGELLGTVELEGIQWTHGVAWLAIGIGIEHQGKGIGTETMRLALDFAFRELNLHRVQLTVFGYNTRAIQLYERVGFIREGSYREFLHRDGKRYDMYLYGLLRREWEAL